MSVFLRGIAWNSLTTVFNQIGGFLRIFVVAAAVGPAGMGSIAVAGSVMAVLIALTEFGARQTYIASSRFAGLSDDEFLGAVWIADVVLKSVLLAVSLPVAYVASLFLGTSQLVQLVFGLCFAATLASFANPALLQQEKAGEFRNVAVVEIAAQVVGSLAAIVVASLTRDPLALVAGAITISAVHFFGSYALCRRPSLRFTLSAIRQVLVHGRHFVTIAVTMFVTYSLDKILLGALVSEPAAGRFFLAQKVAEAPGALLRQAIGRALLPHYASAFGAGERAALWRVVRRILVWIAAATVAVLLLCLAFWALGLSRFIAEDWRRAAPLVPWLFIGVAARLGCSVAAQSLIVRDEVWLDSHLKVQEAIVYLVALPLLVVSAGTNGAVAGFVLMYVTALVRRVNAARAP
jgi:O-antigen/teichoic acid export membrane protein